GLDIRTFAGFSRGDVKPQHLGATPGYNDVTYSHYFIGRSETNTVGMYAQQALLNEGGLKFVSPWFLMNAFGHSDFVASLNLKSSLPIPIVFVFADVATHADDWGFETYEQVVYDAGVGLNVVPNVFEIYLPVVFSEDLKTQVIKPYRTEWYERIVFTLQLENLDPFYLLRNINF
ncbi:MAG TPA: hypothetical protein VEY71_12245, partial [Chitinophagales bacterium]|nr:hypothetical protein [Chitinophagales bacterium]